MDFCVQHPKTKKRKMEVRAAQPIRNTYSTGKQLQRLTTIPCTHLRKASPATTTRRTKDRWTAIQRREIRRRRTNRLTTATRAPRGGDPERPSKPNSWISSKQRLVKRRNPRGIFGNSLRRKLDFRWGLFRWVASLLHKPSVLLDQIRLGWRSASIFL